MSCNHLINKPIDPLSEEHRAKVLNSLEQLFPHEPADEVMELMTSSEFEHALCLICHDYIMRLKED
jgi:hypothetical protein